MCVPIFCYYALACVGTTIGRPQISGVNWLMAAIVVFTGGGTPPLQANG